MKKTELELKEIALDIIEIIDYGLYKEIINPLEEDDSLINELISYLETLDD